jgi:wyosine [tRNA(Phe)-imidazoG37] synthetase (radical SAM superfamily)
MPDNTMVSTIIDLCNKNRFSLARKVFQGLMENGSLSTKRLLNHIDNMQFMAFERSPYKAVVEDFIRHTLSPQNFFRIRSAEGLDIGDISSQLYYSCKMLEGGISIFNKDIKVCCIMPPFSSYTSDTVASYIEPLWYLRKKIVNIVNSGQGVFCSGCQYLVKKEWPQELYPVTHIEIGFTSTCNLRCVYCGTTQNNRHNLYVGQNFDHFKTIESILVDDHVDPNGTFDFGSEGETVIIHDFERILFKLLEYGLKGGCILTNATIFSEAVYRGLETERLSILTSIDAGTRETYKKIRGKDLFETTLANIKKYSKANNGKGVVIKYIMLADNCDDENLLGFIDIFSRMQHEKIVITNDYNVKHCSDEMLDRIRFFATILGKKNMPYELVKTSFCSQDYHKITASLPFTVA